VAVLEQALYERAADQALRARYERAQLPPATAGRIVTSSPSSPMPMAVTVKIPTQLRSVTGGDGETEVGGATTVGEVLDGLYDRYEGLRDRIAVDGDLRRFVNVYVGGEDIRFLDGLDTPVELGSDDRAVAVITARSCRAPRRASSARTSSSRQSIRSRTRSPETPSALCICGVFLAL
jgi:molybdopterin converting factor small subunit